MDEKPFLTDPEQRSEGAARKQSSGDKSEAAPQGVTEQTTPCLSVSDSEIERGEASCAATVQWPQTEPLLTHLLVWGAVSLGNVVAVPRLQPPFSSSTEWALASIPEPVYAVGGTNFTVVLTRPGTLFFLSESGTPARLALPTECVSVACSAHVAFAVGRDGSLYYILQSEEGRVQIDRVSELGDYKIVQVAAGRHHFLALSWAGECFLGGNPNPAETNPDGTVSTKPSILTNIRRIHALYGQPVCRIASGAYHVALITSSGSCFTFGDNRDGQLGNPAATNGAAFVLQPTRVPLALPNDVYVDVACGARHTLILTASGKVVSVGGGRNGQLGHGSTADISTVTVVHGPLVDKHIVAIAAGDSHSLALDAEGTLYAWGAGESGQLGDGDVSDKLRPLPIQAPRLRVAALQVDPESEDGEHLAGATRNLLSLASDAGKLIWCGVSASGNRTYGVVCPSDRQVPIPVYRPLAPRGSPFLQKGSPAPSIDLRAVERFYATPQRSKATLYNLAREQVYLAILAMGDAKMLQEYTEAPNVSSTFNESVLWTPPFPVQHRPPVDAREACGRDPTARRYPEAALAMLALIQNPIFADADAQNRSPALLSRALSLLMRCTTGALERVVNSLREAPAELIIQRFVTPVNDLVSISLRATKRVSQATITAAKFLELVHRAAGDRLPRTVFYNDAVSNIVDLWTDYERWRRAPESFSFCKDAPFLIDQAAKARILHEEARVTQHSEQMQAFFQHVLPMPFGIIGQPLGADTFCVLRVRREHIVSDTLVCIRSLDSRDLLKPLRVEFIGEPAVDEGGVRKEYMMMLMEKLLSPDYGMFQYDAETRYIWFNPHSFESKIEFMLVGLLIGLAVYNGIILEVHFPPILYKRLLGMSVDVADLRDAFPRVAQSLQQLLAYEGKEPVEDVFGLTFSIDYNYWGEIRTYDLVPNGRNIPVTRENRQEFVRLYARYLLVDSVREQFDAFAAGFSMMLSRGVALMLFSPEELEIVVRGEPELDFHALERVTKYEGGYTSESLAVRWFWSIVHDNMKEDDRRRLLAFVTGSDRAPVGGLGKLHFVIQRAGADTDRLPTAHTCFNVLLLPDYSSREKMRAMLDTAIKNAQGFGLQ
jgi:alpha-tubulin suppressor-like RCC1 family protein